MPNDINIQRILFESIKSVLPSHLSLVNEVAEVLCISPDSAYRRIRGEKPISLSEAEKLAIKFNISVDGLLGITTDSVCFKYSYLDEDDFNFHKYFESLLDDMMQIDNNQDVEVIFQLNELNLYHVIQFPELLAFKIYFWSKSILNFKNTQDKKFSLADIDEDMLKVSTIVSEQYAKLNTTELVTQEFLISFLKQIEFYYDSGFFEDINDAFIICEKAIELIDHLKKQAELGYKFSHGINPPGFGGTFKLYSNNLNLVDNVILVSGGGHGKTYIKNGAINLLVTADQEVYERNYRMVSNILKRSTLISTTAERERNLLFNKINKSINELKDYLSDPKRN